MATDMVVEVKTDASSDSSSSLALATSWKTDLQLLKFFVTSYSKLSKVPERLIADMHIDDTSSAFILKAIIKAVIEYFGFSNLSAKAVFNPKLNLDDQAKTKLHAASVQQKTYGMSVPGYTAPIQMDFIMDDEKFRDVVRQLVVRVPMACVAPKDKVYEFNVTNIVVDPNTYEVRYYMLVE